ncbi:70 kDa peptidyl-prolyl isomerase-like [Dioscorea cayenensis subsp. rotundata]|uniref:peptidylprolyl isomerase n=1 Tax=Dioscorea cayennensis subsp. rotundata TaxID=55577 RepID=A0AB40CKH7_DIOCR|nr:70 kDa peptidyl-prolyl isomerase-like [Dioscorea cayenensis subsp. rotundata]
MAHSSRVTFSSAAARAAVVDDDDFDEEPGEVIESAPPLRVGEEREIHPSGLKKKLLRAGRGWETPVFGDEVTVHYVGRLMNGSKFDSSRDRGDPLTFKLGNGEVVSGLDHGLVTMKKGELALFTVPSDLGYGSVVGIQGVPPGADLQFEVELVSWLTVVDICKDGGIIKKIMFSGDDVQAGDLDQVTVKYQVRLSDGKLVAESPEGGSEFYVNEGHLCEAFPKVLKTMRKGEKAVVTVQPQYAFGEHGREAENGFQAIPSNAVLTIDVELVSLKPVVDVSGDLKVLKKVLRSGEGIHRPKDGEAVRIRYTAMLEDGTIFEKLGFDGELFEFVIDEEQVVAGLEQAVGTMLKGELSEVTVKPEYGYGNDETKRDLAILPPCSTLIYQVEMVDFTKEKEPWEMSGPEKIEAAEKTKKAGNDLYKIGKFKRASKKYEKAVSYINEDEPLESGEEKLVKSLRITCWLNHAACCLKLNNFLEAVNLCSKVLDVEFHNVKALYRRAQAYIKTADLDLAKLDIQKALEVDPQNREVKSLQTTLKQLQLENNKRDAKLYVNMFASTRKDTDVVLKRLKVEKANADEVQAMEYEHSASTEIEKPHEEEAVGDSGVQIMEL